MTNTKSKFNYPFLRVWEPNWLTGVQFGYNADFSQQRGGGWRSNTGSLHYINREWIKRSIDGWRVIQDDIPVSTMLLQKSKDNSNYELVVHVDQLFINGKESKFMQYIRVATEQPEKNTVPIMLQLIKPDGGEHVLFPQTFVYKAKSRTYNIICFDEQMLTDSLHVTDNNENIGVNTNAHMLRLSEKPLQILNRIMYLCMFCHRRRINLYGNPNAPIGSGNAGNLPTGALTGELHDISKYSEWQAYNLPVYEGLPQYYYRNTIPTGFFMRIDSGDGRPDISLFTTKEFVLTNVISAYNSFFKTRYRFSCQIVDNSPVVFLRYNTGVKDTVITYDDVTITYDQSEQHTFSYQNVDSEPQEPFYIDNAIGNGTYAKWFAHEYDTDYPFLRTVEVQKQSSAGSVNSDDPLKGMTTGKTSYIFDKPKTSLIVNKDIYLGDRIRFSFKDDITNTTRIATGILEGYTITFDSENKFEQIIELEVDEIVYT
jgi:hypothetical protein